MPACAIALRPSDCIDASNITPVATTAAASTIAKPLATWESLLPPAIAAPLRFLPFLPFLPLLGVERLSFATIIAFL
jgi:hypothetical protein